MFLFYSSVCKASEGGGKRGKEREEKEEVYLCLYVCQVRMHKEDAERSVCSPVCLWCKEKGRNRVHPCIPVCLSVCLFKISMRWVLAYLYIYLAVYLPVCFCCKSEDRKRVQACIPVCLSVGLFVRGMRRALVHLYIYLAVCLPVGCRLFTLCNIATVRRETVFWFIKFVVYLWLTPVRLVYAAYENLLTKYRMMLSRYTAYVLYLCFLLFSLLSLWC